MPEPDTPDLSRDPRSPHASLREAALSGVRWYSIVRVLVESAALVANVLLARLVAPAEFGAVAVATGFITLGSSLFGATFTTPLVQRKEVARKEFETASFLAFVTAALLIPTFVAALPLAARPLFGARTMHFVQLAAVMFPFLALGAIPMAKLQRQLAFRRLSAIELISQLSGSTVSVAAAALGAGGSALIFGLIVVNAVQALMACRSALPARPVLHRRTTRELLGFGAPAGLSTMLFSAYQNVDYMILGARLGAVQVGYYWRAFQLAIEYQGKASRVMLQLAFPLYSRLHDLDAVKRMRARIVRVHASALFPLLALLAAVAPVLIPFVYGDRWSVAIVPTQVLTIAGLAAVVGTGGGPLLTAAGKPRVLLALNTATMSVFAVVVYLTAPLGVVAVALAVVGYQITVVLSIQLVLQRLLGISFAALATDVAPALLGSVAVFVVAFPLTELLSALAFPSPVVLVVVAVIALVTYMAVLRSIFRAAWGDLVLVLRTVGRIPAPSLRLPSLGRRRAALEHTGGAQQT